LRTLRRCFAWQKLMYEPAGTVFYEGLFGKTGAEPDAVAMQIDTVMWVASCTKVTIGIVAQQKC
jgi:phosphoribulokinase